MESLYSPSDIATSSTLLKLNYVYVATAVIWAYDYCLTFSDEIAFLYKSDRGKFKVFYIITRYLPFLVLAIHLYTYLGHGASTSVCSHLYMIDFGLSALSVACSLWMFILRAYALWGRSRKVLLFMTGTFVIIVIAVIAVSTLFKSASKILPPPTPAVTGCNVEGENHNTFFTFVLLIAYELEILLLSLARAVKQHRESRSQLFKVLVHHSIFHFIFAIVFSLANILALLLFTGPAEGVLEVLQSSMHALVVTRMQHQLWQTNRIQVDGAEVRQSISIPLSVLHFADSPTDDVDALQ
ncbi:hypothetical protein BJ138DRAFT_1159583 [Hygrophoropsis aurantiaca]|uniref:Uncharacterized protein n=1 Tax=Hygrophoropsis aurantiaca TaxID=72124 RepID=A0ACB8A2S4_9AGAM|nr:hypothetical protein BJ138DRAFT_1159583 [Hygrophoropsis aurantiaca]